MKCTSLLFGFKKAWSFWLFAPPYGVLFILDGVFCAKMPNKNQRQTSLSRSLNVNVS